jgi:nucleoside diphosphate kinase
LNRYCGSNLQDEYLIIGCLHDIAYLKKTISCANTNGAVITERNILTPLRLFIMSSPIYKAVASGNRNFEFYRETTGSNCK